MSNQKKFFRKPAYIGEVIYHAIAILMVAVIIDVLIVIASLMLFDSNPRNVLLAKTMLWVCLPMMLIVLVITFIDLRHWIHREK